MSNYYSSLFPKQTVKLIKLINNRHSSAVIMATGTVLERMHSFCRGTGKTCMLFTYLRTLMLFALYLPEDSSVYILPFSSSNWENGRSLFLLCVCISIYMCVCVYLCMFYPLPQISAYYSTTIGLIRKYAMLATVSTSIPIT